MFMFVVLNNCSSNFNEVNVGYTIGSGVSDGSYFYFLSLSNLGSPLGLISRIPSSNSFSISNIQTIDLGAIDSDLRGYWYNAMIYQSGYVYGATFRYTFGSTMIGKIVRIDVNNFISAGVTILDLSSIFSSLRGFGSLFSDGLYGYIVPLQVASGSDSSVIGRFLISTFNTAGSEYFDLASVDPSLTGFIGGFSDGRYSYYLGRANVCTDSKIVRVDSQSFNTSGVQWLNLITYDSQIKMIVSGVNYGSNNYFVTSGCGSPDIGKIIKLPTNNFQLSAIIILDLSLIDSRLVGFLDKPILDQNYLILTPVGYNLAPRINLDNFNLAAVSVITLPHSNNNRIGFKSLSNINSYSSSSCYLFSFDSLVNRICNITCFDTVSSGSAFGDPHFIGFDGQEFDFMGEDGETYFLYSSTSNNNDDVDIKLDISAVFKQADHPSRYPQYKNPGFMDMIMVQYGPHQFIYSTSNTDAVFINDQIIQCPLQITSFLHLVEPEVDIYIYPNHILSLNMGSILGSSFEYSVNISLHNDEWMVHYMNIGMSVASSSSSTGLLGQTRRLLVNTTSSAGGVGIDSIVLKEDEIGNQYWQNIVDENPQQYLVTNKK